MIESNTNPIAHILFFLLLSLATSNACLWDRDTLAEETKGRPEVLKIIVGWFDRYPDRYYQMRLERVAREIAERPDELGLYDDAAVACDRLGQGDQAIAWMERKKGILDAVPADEIKDHRYRYLANLGTFLTHRWIRQSEAIRNVDLSPLRDAERLIAQAIKENPDAHFGREVYQLNAIRWMLWDGKSPIESVPETGLEFSPDSWIAVSDGTIYLPSDMADFHISGITGLIQLRAAWQSLDAFHTLTGALESREYSSLAGLSYLREEELVAQGATSILSPRCANRSSPSQSSCWFIANRSPRSIRSRERRLRLATRRGPPIRPPDSRKEFIPKRIPISGRNGLNLRSRRSPARAWSRNSVNCWTSIRCCYF